MKLYVRHIMLHLYINNLFIVTFCTVVKKNSDCVEFKI